MARQPHLHKRGDTYYFRLRVPADLSAHYDGKAELKFSLRTADEFAVRRNARARSQGPEPAQTLAWLDTQAITGLTSLWTQSCLDGDKHFYEQEAGELSDAELDAREAQQREVLAALRQALARGRTDPIRPVLESFLHMAGIGLDVDEASRRRLERAFLKATAQLTEVRLQRMQGEVVETRDVVDPAQVMTVAAARPAPGGGNGFTFEAMFELWRSRTARAETGVADMQVALRYFREYLGEARTPAGVSHEDVEGFCAHLAQAHKLVPKTVDKRLGQVRALYSLAVRKRKLATNPTLGVEVPGATEGKRGRVAYAIDDVKAILGTPVFTAGRRPKGGKGEAAVWLPLLALYSGARIEELAQLRVADVDREDGVDHLRITDAGPQQCLKNKGSRRRIPLHPALVEAGFLRYVERLRGRQADRLFPVLTPDCKGRWSGHFSKWFNRYQRVQAGIDDRRKTFHSFRHLFKTAARRARLSEETHDALTGHANGAVGRAYGDYPLDALYAAICEIEYPGLTVPVIELERRAPAESAAA